ncbi:putative Co/Zn/Cd efflux system membrane fusion protein [Chitinispirillum alkaliphilum]|nr:putative Co/Zn/Cd efflux system membrane fusion protein [Chitinispirillum alkaliphilum]
MKPDCMKSIIFISVIFILISCNNQEGSTDQQQSGTNPSTVEGVILRRGIFNPWLEKSGVIAGRNEVTVISETEGVILFDNFEIGDRVEKNSVLVSVDRDEARFAMNQAQEQLRAAELNLQASRRLFEQNILSRSEYEEAQSAYSGARSSFEAARQRFQNTRVRSPIEGEVASKEQGISLGNYISPGSLVARIIDKSKFRINLAVGEKEIGLIQAGADAQVAVPAIQGDSVFHGIVKAVSAGARPASGSYPVVVEFDNNDSRIRSGMSANVRIRTTEADSVLLIPSAALIRNNDKFSVYHFSSHTAQRTDIRLGRRMGDIAEVRSGVSVGDTVITSGTTTIDHGDSVNIEVIGESGDWQ